MSVTPQQGLNYFKNTTLTELVDRHPLNVNNKGEEESVIESVVTMLHYLNEI